MILALIIVACATVFAGAVRADSTGTLQWRGDEQLVDANISGWDLDRLLKSIAEATRWQVFVEPETTHTISAKFKDLAPGEALRLLLGKINFALVPDGAEAKLFVFRTNMQEATARVVAEKNAESDLIPNELIVTMKAGAKVSIHELARQVGATVVGCSEELNACRLQFPDEASANAARELLAKHPDVESVDANHLLRRPPQPQVASATNQLPNYRFTEGDNPCVIALVDTALSPPDGLSDWLLPAISVAGEANLSEATLTHATTMAYSVVQGAEGASIMILPVDAFGGNPTTTAFEVTLGIIAAVEGGADTIVLSLGGESPSDFMHRVIQDAHKTGRQFFGAAGNQPVTTPTFPAAFPEVFAVTAGDKSGNIAAYANRGDFIDGIAPGSILVPFNGAVYEAHGTSVATALAAGQIAAQRCLGK